jgi:protein-S-isoprenylcysteine O-methyltransferase Ste14
VIQQGLMMTPAQYFISSVLLLLVAFLTFRVLVRHDYLKRGRLSTPSVFLEYAVFVGWGTFTWLDWSAATSISEVGPVVRLIAWILIIVGVGVTLIAMARLGIRRLHGLDPEALEGSGPYGVTRNPQIVASGLAVIGYAMYWPSWHTVGWVALYLAICHMMALTEEEHLRRVFGEQFEQYCERVPRYLRLRRKR